MQAREGICIGGNRRHGRQAGTYGGKKGKAGKVGEAGSEGRQRRHTAGMGHREGRAGRHKARGRQKAYRHNKVVVKVYGNCVASNENAVALPSWRHTLAITYAEIRCCHAAVVENGQALFHGRTPQRCRRWRLALRRCPSAEGWQYTIMKAGWHTGSNSWW